MTNDDIKRIASEAAREMIMSATAAGQRTLDAEDIASAVIARMQHTDGICPNGMDRETVKALKDVLPELNEFVKLYRGGKTSLRVMIIGVITLGAGFLFVAGVIAKIKEWTGKP